MHGCVKQYQSIPAVTAISMSKVERNVTINCLQQVQIYYHYWRLAMHINFGYQCPPDTMNFKHIVTFGIYVAVVNQQPSFHLLRDRIATTWWYTYSCIRGRDQKERCINSEKWSGLPIQATGHLFARWPLPIPSTYMQVIVIRWKGSSLMHQ